MGRQLRVVPPGWQHPKDKRGNYIPLLKGPYSKRAADWDEAAAHWAKGEMQDNSEYPAKKWVPKARGALDCSIYEEWNGARPEKSDYMPEWADGEAAMFVMYEDTSEGTPISPAFATIEELARWLADNGASSFAGFTATYEEWLDTCGRGSAVSMIISNGVMQSGVQGMAGN